MCFLVNKSTEKQQTFTIKILCSRSTLTGTHTDKKIRELNFHAVGLILTGRGGVVSPPLVPRATGTTGTESPSVDVGIRTPQNGCGHLIG